MSGAPRSDDPFEGVEPGLAAERTDLAWSRSGLSLMACGVAIAKGIPVLSGSDSRPVIGTVFLVLGAAVWLLGWEGARRRRPAAGERRRTARYGDVAPIAVGTAAVGAAGVVLVVFQAS